MHPEMTDESLMLAFRDGEEAAFDLLYRRYRGRLYRYLLHQCAHPATAEELYQDVWLRVVRARSGYEVSARFSTWLFRIAHNRLMDHFRSEQRAALASYEEEPDREPAAAENERPDRLAERRRVAQQLVDEIDALPPAQREAFLLAEEGELTVAEIAAATGVGRETAKSRLRYALARLRRALREPA